MQAVQQQQQQQQPQQQQGLQSYQQGQGPYFSIDVEAVATGTTHNDRAVAQISLVDQFEQVQLNLYVLPHAPVVSYLRPLTGLSKEILDARGIPFQQAINTLRSALPRNAIIVGQNIRKDIEWLGLREGVDFESLLDLAGLYRCWNPQYKSWSVFGQDHVAKVLLGWDVTQPGDSQSSHDAVRDAVKSMRLFNHYNQMQAVPGAWEQVQAALLATPPPSSFAKLNPTFEGVCMGNRKTCSCGAAFFS